MEMPPKKPRLPAAVLADLDGLDQDRSARIPLEVTAEAQRADKSWLSLQPLAHRVRSTPASTATSPRSWPRTELDFNPPAGPAALIARMTYDLTGLPPTPEEQDAFVTAARRDPQRCHRSAGRPPARLATLWRTVGPTLARRDPLRREQRLRAQLRHR
jgi:hypothetical protein